MNNVKVGLVQMSCVKDVATNIEKAKKEVRNAAAKGAQIVCLQELFTSLYFCDVEDYDNFQLAEAIPGPTTETMCVLAKELGVVIIASLFEKRAEGLYHNTTAVIDADGTYLGKYRKMHIFMFYSFIRSLQFKQKNKYTYNLFLYKRNCNFIFQPN